MIHLDASTLEGGGQLPRLALCLSALTLTPIHLTNIRANRASNSRSSFKSRSKSNPRAPTGSASTGKDGGLKESHLAALQFLSEACGAKVTGDELGSREVTFKPRSNCSFLHKSNTGVRKFEIELKNPGSVFLILQALYPYVIFSQTQRPQHRLNEGHGRQSGNVEEKGKSSVDSDDTLTTTHRIELMLKGGTNVDKSMSLEYVQQVFLPICKKIGLPDTRVECVKRGWAGAKSEIGEVTITMDLPKSETGFQLTAFSIADQGEVEKVVVNVLAHSSELRQDVIQKVVEKSSSAFGENVTLEVEVNEDSSHESRLYILLVAHTSNGWRLGRDFLGSGRKARNETERQIILEKAVSKVVGDLGREIESGACVDEHMQDQLVVFQALADGKSVVRGRDDEGTLHAQTARWVSEQLIQDRGLVFDSKGGCDGIGWNTDLENVSQVVGGISKLDLGDNDQDDS